MPDRITIRLIVALMGIEALLVAAGGIWLADQSRGE